MNLKDLNFSQLVKLSVEQGGLPRYIYKYRPINIYTEKIFLDSKLWFSKPCDFNDPFDCQVIVDTSNTAEQIAFFLQLHIPTMPSSGIEKLSIAWSKNKSEWNRIVNETIQKSVNSKGVCCFAGNNDNILMWSHYTDSHKGICIKFDVLADTDFFSAAFKINYDKNYPHYNHIQDNSRMVKFLMQTKSDIWEYEGEIRVLKLLSAAYPIRKEALTEVCFGCNCSEEDIEKVKNLVSTNEFNNILFTKAVKAKQHFGLEIKNL